ncbi:MAG: Calx-beta domain-containing protein [Allosphingosinicella sp.]
MLTASAAALASAAQAGESVTYTYDALGRLTATSSTDTVNPGVTSSIGYDAAGNRSIYAASVSGAPAFSVSDVSAIEGGGLVFTVVKNGAGAASVNYATANGSAGAGDFTGASGTLSFVAAESVKTVSIATIDDSIDESSETALLNLSSPSAGATIADSQGVGTIFDNDDPPPPPPPPPPVFSIGDASVTEGGALLFTVTKTGATIGSFAVGFSTANVSAVASFVHYNPGDYYMTSSSIAFGPTETSKTISIYTYDDIIDENNETLLVNLTSPTGGSTISDSQGVGTIVDNDDPPPPPPPGNLAPTPQNDIRSQKNCVTVYHDVLTNDTDPDGDTPLTLVSSTNPVFQVAGNTIAVDGSQIGSGDSTVYTVRDTRNATATATLTVNLTTGRCSDD